MKVVPMKCVAYWSNLNPQLSCSFYGICQHFYSSCRIISISAPHIAVTPHLHCADAAFPFLTCNPPRQLQSSSLHWYCYSRKGKRLNRRWGKRIWNKGLRGWFNVSWEKHHKKYWIQAAMTDDDRRISNIWCCVSLQDVLCKGYVTCPVPICSTAELFWDILCGDQNAAVTLTSCCYIHAV